MLRNKRLSCTHGVPAAYEYGYLNSIKISRHVEAQESPCSTPTDMGYLSSIKISRHVEEQENFSSKLLWIGLSITSSGISSMFSFLRSRSMGQCAREMSLKATGVIFAGAWGSFVATQDATKKAAISCQTLERSRVSLKRTAIFEILVHLPFSRWKKKKDSSLQEGLEDIQTQDDSTHLQEQGAHNNFNVLTLHQRSSSHRENPRQRGSNLVSAAWRVQNHAHSASKLVSAGG